MESAIVIHVSVLTAPDNMDLPILIKQSFFVHRSFFLSITVTVESKLDGRICMKSFLPKSNFIEYLFNQEYFFHWNNCGMVHINMN